MPIWLSSLFHSHDVHVKLIYSRRTLWLLIINYYPKPITDSHDFDPDKRPSHVQLSFIWLRNNFVYLSCGIGEKNWALKSHNKFTTESFCSAQLAMNVE